MPDVEKNEGSTPRGMSLSLYTRDACSAFSAILVDRSLSHCLRFFARSLHAAPVLHGKLRTELHII